MVDGVDPGLKTKMEISSRGDTQKRMEAEARVLMIGSQGHSSCLKEGEVSSGRAGRKRVDIAGATFFLDSDQELTLPGQQLFGFRSRTKGSKDIKDDEEFVLQIGRLLSFCLLLVRI